MDHAHTPTDSFLTAQELAAILRVRPGTVLKWAKQGIIPAIQIRPKTVRFDLAAVRAALASRGAGQGVDRA